jgi:hypothetical protein
MNRSMWLPLSLALTMFATGCGKKDAPGEAAPAASGAASGAASAAAAPGVLDRLKDVVSSEVTLQHKAPAVGDKRKVEETGEITMQMMMGKQEMKFTEKTAAKRTEEVLAVDGSTVTKLKVTYELNSKESIDDKKTRKTPDLLSGKTFILEAVKGQVTVTQEGGKPVVGPAKTALLKEFKTFGQPDKIQTAINGRKLKMNEPIPELSAAFDEQMKATMDDGRGGLVMDSSRILLKRKDGDFAIFEAVVNAHLTKGMMRGVAFQTTSELAVHVTDARQIKTTTRGTIGLSPEEKAKSKASLDGTIQQQSVSSAL